MWCERQFGPEGSARLGESTVDRLLLLLQRFLRSKPSGARSATDALSDRSPWVLHSYCWRTIPLSPHWGVKSGSRQEVRATVVGFETGPLLAIIQGT